MATVVPSYKGFRYPVEIISHCVWLYHRFPLSFREVEEMMMERGVVVSHEGIVNLGGGLATGMIGYRLRGGLRGAGLVGTGTPSYKGFRYPVEIISHCVWLYHRFPLSFREVEEMMLERGVTVSHETIRQWTGKFGQAYANGLRRRRPRPGDQWHLDEVFIKINGKTHY